MTDIGDFIPGINERIEEAVETMSEDDLVMLGPESCPELAELERTLHAEGYVLVQHLFDKKSGEYLPPLDINSNVMLFQKLLLEAYESTYNNVVKDQTQVQTQTQNYVSSQHVQTFIEQCCSINSLRLTIAIMRLVPEYINIPIDTMLANFNILLDWVLTSHTQTDDSDTSNSTSEKQQHKQKQRPIISNDYVPIVHKPTFEMENNKFTPCYAKSFVPGSLLCDFNVDGRLVSVFDKLDRDYAKTFVTMSYTFIFNVIQRICNSMMSDINHTLQLSSDLQQSLLTIESTLNDWTNTKISKLS